MAKSSLHATAKVTPICHWEQDLTQLWKSIFDISWISNKADIRFLTFAF